MFKYFSSISIKSVKKFEFYSCGSSCSLLSLAASTSVFIEEAKEPKLTGNMRRIKWTAGHKARCVDLFFHNTFMTLI